MQDYFLTGSFEGWQMVFYGTDEDPVAPRMKDASDVFINLSGDTAVKAEPDNHLEPRAGDDEDRHARQRTTTEVARQAAKQSSSGCSATSDRSVICLGLSILFLVSYISSLQKALIHLGTLVGALSSHKTDVDVDRSKPEVRWRSSTT